VLAVDFFALALGHDQIWQYVIANFIWGAASPSPTPPPRRPTSKTRPRPRRPCTPQPVVGVGTRNPFTYLIAPDRERNLLPIEGQQDGRMDSSVAAAGKLLGEKSKSEIWNGPCFQVSRQREARDRSRRLALLPLSS
jgi:hypothetical protein